MNRLRFLFTLFLLPVVLLACSDNGPDNLDPEDFAGFYVLQTVNGTALPQTMNLDGVNITVNHASAWIYEDDHWDLDFVGLVGGSNRTIEFFGNYEISGNKLNLEVMDDDWETVLRKLKASIQVDAETLTVVYGTYTLVFKKGTPV